MGTGELQFWSGGNCMYRIQHEMAYMPRENEFVHIADVQYKVLTVGWYIGDTGLNKPHVRIYMVKVRT